MAGARRARRGSVAPGIRRVEGVRPVIVTSTPTAASPVVSFVVELGDGQSRQHEGIPGTVHRGDVQAVVEEVKVNAPASACSTPASTMG